MYSCDLSSILLQHETKYWTSLEYLGDLLGLHLNSYTCNCTLAFEKSTCILSIHIIYLFRFYIAAVVEDFPPDLRQPTNLLVTLLTYSSIAVQNTKGIQWTIILLQGVGHVTS